MKRFSLAAKGFLALTVLAGAAVLLYAVIHLWPASPLQFFLLLGLAVVASRFRVKLPGVNGTMSVNLPFFLMATASLSISEAVVVACLGPGAIVGWTRKQGRASRVQCRGPY